MKRVKEDDIRKAVRDTYGEVARTGGASACCGSSSTCCGTGSESASVEDASVRLGYSSDDVASAPEGANMGLGCGNPQAIASLRPGETVLDLGSGGGFDCFLAARAVGETGRVIGVDMTPEMVHKARANAEKGGFKNVDFRLGEIENLPVADDTADVLMSNCVINLSPDKQRVFNEAYRALKPGGRLAISDVVATAELPEEAKRDLALVAGCTSGAALIDEVQAMLEQSGFTRIRVNPVQESRELIHDWAPGAGMENYVVSATIVAVKP